MSSGSQATASGARRCRTTRIRITSYNVCYTKLLRARLAQRFGGGRGGAEIGVRQAARLLRRQEGHPAFLVSQQVSRELSIEPGQFLVDLSELLGLLAGQRAAITGETLSYNFV